MSLNTMARRMCLEVPKMVDTYAVTLLQEALIDIYKMRMWSFQLKTSGWLTPGLLFPGGPGTSVGTVTVTPYSPKVIGDATSSAAWQTYIAGGNQPLFTQLQFRSPYYSLYNIIAVDTTSNPPFTTLTLDRPWLEPGGTQQSYMIYQAYFPVPVSDFKRFLSARDTTNNYPMDYWSKSQKDLAVNDPERTIFDDPNYFVPFEQDTRLGSATFGNMLYELWPHPLSVLPYTYQFLRQGPPLVLPSDTVPYPLTEELVLWKAKASAFLYKEAQKGEDVARGSGADYKFLSGAAEAQFKGKLKPIKDHDRDLVELYWTKYRLDPYNEGEPYANINGGLNIGTM
jgi:hypothetical protein